MCGVVLCDSALLAVVVHLPMPCLACPVQLAVQAGVVPASTPVEAVQSLLTPRSSAIAAAGGGGGRHFDFSMPPPSDMPPTPSLDLDANDIAEFFSMPSPYPRHADGFAFPYVLPAWLQDVGRTLTCRGSVLCACMRVRCAIVVAGRRLALLHRGLEGKARCPGDHRGLRRVA